MTIAYALAVVLAAGIGSFFGVWLFDRRNK